MSWKKVDLHGSVSISRLCGEYDIREYVRLPGPGYRVKVFERGEGFVAYSNVAFRMEDGTVDGISGAGASELEALQDVINGIAGLMATRPSWTDADLDWMDPRDF